MCFLAKQVRAPLADPVHHAAAAELVAAALALRVAVALQGLDGGVAVGAGLADLEGEGFCVAVNGLLTFTIVLAALVDVLGAIAAEAELEVAVLAGEDSAVSLAIVVLVGLEGVFAAVHAGDAFFQQLFHGVSGLMLVQLEKKLCILGVGTGSP